MALSPDAVIQRLRPASEALERASKRSRTVNEPVSVVESFDFSELFQVATKNDTEDPFPSITLDSETDSVSKEDTKLNFQREKRNLSMQLFEKQPTVKLSTMVRSKSFTNSLCDMGALGCSSFTREDSLSDSAAVGICSEAL